MMTLEKVVSGTLKAFSVKIRARLIILEVGARFITACIRNSSAPFFQKKGPKRAQFEKNEPRGRRITALSNGVCFGKIKIRFP
jgi:hypothetical protein